MNINTGGHRNVHPILPKYDSESHGSCYRTTSSDKNDGITLFSNSVTGAGRCTKKISAKSLAALEVILRLEEEMEVPNGYLLKKLEDYIKQENEKTGCY